MMDRRASTPTCPCKTCGVDMGIYPSMHKCQQQRDLNSPLPPLPTRRYSHTSNPLQVPRKPIHHHSYSGSESHIMTTSPTLHVSPPSNSPFRLQPKTTHQAPTDVNYMNNFTMHLPQQEKKSRRFRYAKKWEQWTHQDDLQKHSGKLWGKLRLAAQTMVDKMPSHNDHGPESDDSDWEGETHVSRILREYYVKKHRPLPHWFDANSTSRPRLWDQAAPVPERNGDNIQRNHPSETHRMFDQSPSQQDHRTRHDDHLQPTDSTNRQDHRLSHQERRFSMDHARQQQLWDGGRKPMAFQHDRLYGPRLRPNNHH